VAAKIGDITQAMHDDAGALVSYREAEQMLSRLSTENPQSADLRRTHGILLARVAGSHMNLQRPREAVEFSRQALAILEALAVADPENIQTQIDLSGVYASLGEALSGQGDAAAAIKAARQAVSIRERARARNPDYAAEDLTFAAQYRSLGRILLTADDVVGALAAYGKAAEIVAVEPVRSQRPSMLAEIHEEIGEAHVRRARDAPAAARAAALRAARQSFEQSLAVWVALRAQGKLAADQADQPEQLQRRIESLATLDR
jgi:tetratricopeptide (TPR) repeat protein